MAYNTKAIKLDVNQKPIPQIYNPVTDEYEVLQGENGASRHIIYGTDGQPISTTGNKLAVRASEIETLLESLDGKDFATQTTLSQILAKIIAAPATEAKQTAIELILNSLDGKDYSTLAKQNEILAKLAALETKLSSDPATQTTLAAILAKIIAAPATEAKQDTLIGHVDGIIDGTTPATVQLSGSKMKLYGASLADRPAATAVAVGTTFTIVDDARNYDSWISDGTNWLEV